ncbi:MAG: hypothetical protein JWQ38_63 [Flavipsychrobacter sp.]|nr:hypothetical protein [Flavipsychrobacter sp.]
MIKYILAIFVITTILSTGCKSVAKFPIDAPSMGNLEDGLIGKWKFEEDTDKRNYYEVVRGGSYATDKYHVFFWNRGGTNPTYEGNVHISKINGARFINVPYWENNGKDAHFSNAGYFFLRILQVNTDFTKMTTATVHDTTMRALNQAELKQRITKNINNPVFYYDTVHFYKMK